jgi:lactate dehydrogenase-like 2-hydroxyacid dehydrogenase
MSKVLQVGPLMPAVAQALRDDYDAHVLPDGVLPDDPAFLVEHGGEITVVVTSGAGAVDAALMDALPNLGAIVNFGVGYDTIDVDAARARGIGVSNTPDVLNDAVADTAVALVLDTLRGFSAADRFVRAGRWPVERMFPLTRDVRGARVGILGLGRIGRAIALRLLAFGCSISYHNRRRVPDVEYPYAASPVELAASVDVLVVAVTGGPSSTGLVDRAVLDALGPEGYLVNVSRGRVVDEAELVAALVEGRLAGAGLDVYTDEPHVPKALTGLDNVVLLPHVGSATVQTRAAMGELTLRNVASFLKTGELVTPVG